MNSNEYNAKITKLMEAFIEVQECMGINDGVTIEEYANKMAGLFSILDHDWTSGMKELHNLWKFYTFNSKSGSRMKKVTWDNVSGHLQCISALCNYRDFIGQQQMFFEQLDTSLHHEYFDNAISIWSDPQQIMKVSYFLRHLVDKLNLPDTLSFRIQQATHEAVNNGIMHGNKNQVDQEIRIRAYRQGNKLVISVKDAGKGFDFQKLTYELPDVFKESGRGLFLIKQITDELWFEDGGSKILFSFYLDKDKS